MGWHARVRLRWLLVAALTLAFGAEATAQTLAAVKQRGTLNCGVSQGFAGFSAPDSRGEFRGLDADLTATPEALSIHADLIMQMPAEGEKQGD